MRPSGDTQLVQIIDAALADATRRAGPWLKCRQGCTQCCLGPFAINQLDVARLRQGLEELKLRDAQRAARIVERARASVARLAPDFPGDTKTGLLAEDSESAQRFLGFADDEPCPVLDPQTGACELYEWRPLTCRVFGPPVATDGGLGVCELNFQGASNEEIAACEMEVDPNNLEPALIKEAEKKTGARGQTIVAFSMAG